MTPSPNHSGERRAEPLPDGMLEYETRCAIRDLIRLHGFEAARDLVAGYLNDEAERNRQ